MPYRDTPWVRAARLYLPDQPPLALDTPAWFAWLNEGTTFGYSSPRVPLRLTIRREVRRGHSYWYGYSKIDAKLHNIYLGKSASLTQVRLEQACLRLWKKQQKQQTAQGGDTKRG